MSDSEAVKIVRELFRQRRQLQSWPVVAARGGKQMVEFDIDGCIMQSKRVTRAAVSTQHQPASCVACGSVSRMCSPSGFTVAMQRWLAFATVELTIFA